MGEQQILDLLALLVLGIISVGALRRIRAGLQARTNKALLAAHIALMIAALGALSSVYAVIDPLLGGGSYFNLVTHLLIAFASWALSYGTVGALRIRMNGPLRKLLLGRWSLMLALCGVLAGFFWVAPDGSVRGLEEYETHPGYVLYWVATILPVLLAGPPVLRGLIVSLKGWMPLLSKSARLAHRFLLAGFGSAPIVAALFVLTAFAPELQPLRELFSYTCMISLAVGLMFIPSGRRLKSERTRRLQPGRR